MEKKHSHTPLEEQLNRLKKELRRLRRDREVLLESKRMLATLMNNLPGMVCRCANDAQWTVEFASRGTCDLLGFEPEKLAGIPFSL